MKKVFLSNLFLVSTLCFHVFAMDKDSFFEQSDRFFETNISDYGMVDYEKIKLNRDPLDRLLEYIHQANTGEFSEGEKKAFYINAYNLLVIGAIIDHYPVASPMKIPSFFDGTKHKVGGVRMTLNDLENKKLRLPYDDPRIHFVLVCAAVSCPKIANYAYKPDELDEQLDQRTKLALNDPVFIQQTAKKILISEIFKWYRNDFAKNDSGILEYINKYREVPLDMSKKLDYYSYDWALNDVP